MHEMKLICMSRHTQMQKHTLPAEFLSIIRIIFLMKNDNVVGPLMYCVLLHFSLGYVHFANSLPQE